MPRTLKIHPAIGIARLGSSEKYFVGPELPLNYAIPDGGYRDGSRLLKRQGARFRIFMYEDGSPPREVTTAEADISWTVHLANTKAAAEWFRGPRQAAPAAHPMRNGQYVGDDRQKQLVIDPGPASVKPGKTVELAFNGSFTGKALSLRLGTLVGEDGGSLVVLGGFGKAGSPNNIPIDQDPSNFANCEGWFDDVSDGPVQATVTFKDGSPSPAVVPSWVIAAPPKYAPGLQNIVTLYDSLIQRAIDSGMIPDPSMRAGFKPSFTNDIYPVLRRAVGMTWVCGPPGTGGQPVPFHTFPMPDAPKLRIFNQLGVPGDLPGSAAKSGGPMPKMWSDDFDRPPNGTLTKLQYATMAAWKNNTFVSDWKGPPPPATDITPDGMDRAALEPCVGAPFYPGIEASWGIRDRLPYIEPLRLDASKLTAGAVTSQMAVPWQSDFLDCSAEPPRGGGPELVWWPAQRPMQVRAKAGGPVLAWDRSFEGPGGTMDVLELIKNWDRLGFILEQQGGYFETDRVDGPTV
jgi:hypothetical protein